MSNDLFGMAVENRKSIKELIIVSSPRIDYYPLVEAARNFIPALLFDNLHLISLDKTLINGLLVCKHCHMLFTDARWNRPVFLKHLTKFHDVERKEPIPEPTIPKKPKNKAIQFTDTPITINLIDPNTELSVPPKESEKPKEEVTKLEQPPAPSEPARKTHHKKKIPIKVEPICLDTIYDQNYVPTTPFPIVSKIAFEDLEWEAPLDKKPKSKKRKAPATTEPNATSSSITVAKKPKKARKRPMLGGEEKKPKTSTKPRLHAQPPRTKKTPKAPATPSKEAEIKELGW
jgi:hypothetical protein